jgi:23S rRNA pseudouridine1911/1915/1917 synthase
MKEFSLKVGKSDSGMRLDLYLIKNILDKNLGISRTSIQKLIRDGKVTLNDKSVKSHHKVKTGELFVIKIEEPKPTTIEPEHIPLDIVYQDSDLAVINKPSGMVVHPGSGNYQHTLVNAILYHFKDLSHIHPKRPGIVHRLDKDTSGLILIAKNDKTHLGLAKQFAKHTIKRQYTALVKGKMEFDENVIDLPIGRHRRNFEKMSIDFSKKAKFAKTYYRTLKRSPQASLVQLSPFTGRTHQLRVHLDFIGHPILGDCKYGKNNIFVRLALHANYIGFLHPGTLKFMEFSTPIPEEFIHWLDKQKP